MANRPVEADVQLPLWISAHATPAALRMPDNPLERAVYQRGRAFGVRTNEGIVEYIRCRHCGELKEARRWNFRPDERNKSGYRHQCRDCENTADRSRKWSDRNLQNVHRGYGNRQLNPNYA